MHMAIYFLCRKTVHFCITRNGLCSLFAVSQTLSVILTVCFYTCNNSHDGKDTPRLMEVQVTQFQAYSFLTTVLKKKKPKVKQSHYKPDRTWGFQEVQTSRQQDNQHVKVVRLSGLRTRCLYSPGNIPVTPFSHRLSWPWGHSAASRIM